MSTTRTIIRRAAIAFSHPNPHHQASCYTKLLSETPLALRVQNFSRCSTTLRAKQSKTNNNNDNSDGQSSTRDKLAEARKLIPRRYRVFDDQDTQIIYDDTLDLDVILNQKQKKHQPRPANQISADLVEQGGLRGKRGVFDIHELFRLLREEKMQDIVTIAVPPELKYCDYMVLCTANSTRHIKTFIETLNRLYKLKKNREDPFLNLEDRSNDWRLIDMRNIILHLFQRETREYYDIETLWAVGEQFDDKIQRPDRSVVQDIMSKHLSWIDRQVSEAAPNQQ